MIKSLQTEYLLEINNLVDRAYKSRDLALFEKYSTAISIEAEKVVYGIYETRMSREVFVAYSSKDMDKVSELAECEVSFDNNVNYKKAIRYGDPALVKKLKTYLLATLEHIDAFRKDQIYNEACAKMKINNKEAYRDVISKFDTIPSYRDSEVRIEQCRKRISEIIYYDACELKKLKKKKAKKFLIVFHGMMLLVGLFLFIIVYYS